MGASVNAAPARVGRFPDSAEINVVPFVDVMLVLLIIFMVAAPMATTSFSITLPPSSDAPPPDPKDAIFVSIGPDHIIVSGSRTTLAGLGATIRAQSKGDFDSRIMMRADSGVLYGDVTNAMEAVRREGFVKVVLIAEDVI